MEHYLGRKLTRHEVVHHIDGNPLNNDRENLKLMSLSEHSRMHRLSQGNIYSTSSINKLRTYGRIHRTRAKMTVFDIKNIKRMLRDGIKQKLIAWVYQVHITTISKINCDRTWSWIS